MRFDPVLLSAAWQSVSAACGEAKLHHPRFVDAVRVEFHATGAWLAATDGALLLTAWVPDQAHTLEDPCASPSSEPKRAVTVLDANKRGRALIAYAAKRSQDDDTNIDDWFVRLDVVTTAGGALPGMDATTLEIGAMRDTVTLSTQESDWIDWSSLIAAPLPAGIECVGLGPWMLAKLVKAAKPHTTAVIRAGFTGSLGAIHVELVNSEPFISGVCMPVKLDEPTVDLDGVAA